MKLILALVLAASVGGGEAGGLPSVVGSTGQVWPKPQTSVTQDTFMTLNASDFKFTVSEQSCELLSRVLDRYTEIIKTLKPVHPTSEGSVPFHEDCFWAGQLSTVDIWLMNSCAAEDLPHPDMDEHYQIKIDSPDQPGKARIIATTVWGMMRGVESFTHLLVEASEQGLYRVNSTQIMDFPRFSHRGFLIDTSRHFLPVSHIKLFLDALAINKFNVLHWHIVDDPSFPYYSAIFPGLSGKGAYSSAHVYSQKDVADVIRYAGDRGIRVIPEFDTPGHSQSWGLSQPGLLTTCCSGGKPDGSFGPIDPSHDANYDFLQKLLQEAATSFPDKYLHLGGDEVPFGCWQSNPNITAFMKAHGIAGNYSALEQYYISKVLRIVEDFPNATRALVWQEVFDNGVELHPETIVHVWKGGPQAETARVTAAGYHTIVSSPWYLNYIHYGNDWTPFYTYDPQNFNGTVAQKQLVMGGEAAMWGEYVDKTNVIARSWPRGAAVGERLWSNSSVKSVDTAWPRIHEHRCRMLARGLNVEPFGYSSFCPTDV